MKRLIVVVILVGIAILSWFFIQRATEGGKDIMVMNKLELVSPAFEHNGNIPSLYTCDEERTRNPEFSFEGVPENTVSLAIIMDDPDIPQVFKDERGIEDFDHWALFNIPSDTAVIPEGESVGVVGANGRGENSYTGPCPPPEFEPTEHRYIFKLYALDAELALEEGATHEEIRAAMEGHVIEETELVGLYDRAEK